ncbi:MAG TPA: helix-turn-helix domain-containing protein, partial [Solirubrobacteraceae bacterium]|nr:helix-turn-helix domain-containing protein [Solirubrobacteraceae bacterium]
MNTVVAEQIRATVQARLRELEPVLIELEQLQSVLAALDEPGAQLVPGMTAGGSRRQEAIRSGGGRGAGVMGGGIGDGGIGDGGMVAGATGVAAGIGDVAGQTPLRLLDRVATNSALGGTRLASVPRPYRLGSRRGSDGRAPQGANKQRILAAIAAHPGLAAPEIAQLTGLKRPVVASTISRLKRT